MTGLWKVEDCESKHGFICKRNIGEQNHINMSYGNSGSRFFSLKFLFSWCPFYKDSQIEVPATTVLPKAFQKLGNDSYKLVTQKMKWDEARRQCLADDADLASVLNPVDQAYLTLHISKHNEPVWIGLNSNEVKGSTSCWSPLV